ncbi:hypothetical protein LMG6871_01849 [Ralstonia edaphis]|uniref:hypothetical protein n=1 Tax=Ralstonia edaphi TaxID=3058599 RepID=UPI0028F6096E|nr:hypothetical protein [Ralstonia sp. LMG 6871]CAJ0716603.1 hypothetical protein LMG6871_01849 [Ralstonia sp. LMG 6871]
MSFGPATPVCLQPSATLVRWRVFETERGERHFAGYCIESGHGRVTSAIMSFDPQTAIGLSSSGRAYQLRGESGFDDDADYVWVLWSLYNKVEWSKDVSHEYRVFDVDER